ncbi:hypothetical protein [Methylobacterium tarhaniae]|uniref:hypothetical protein n=1 Tax=Methylobacterium tarhaniae TaxID=1187852 RepID=UPI00069CEA56|nr:hypothetical protein [Methylobacterium tarhaniae]
MATLPQPEVPPEAERVVGEVLSELAARSAFRTPKLSRADPRTLSLTAPHRVAVLPLALLQGGREVKPVERGWRFLIAADGEVIAGAEALARPDGRFAFGGLNEGPLVASFAAALQDADVREPGVEARLLLTPALHVAALWVVEVRPPEEERLLGGDVIVPIEPTHPRLPARRAVTAAAYLAILRSLAAGIPPGGAKGG